MFHRSFHAHGTRPLSQPVHGRARRAQRFWSPGVEGLESRRLLAGIDPSLPNLLKALNNGVADIQSRSGTIADAAFNLDLPMLKDTLGATFNVAGAIAGSLPKTIKPSDVLNDARAQLSNYAKVEQLAITPDARGDYIRLTIDKQLTPPRASFDIGGRAGLAYFDDHVTGEVQGKLLASVKALVLHLTIGVDLRDGAPAVYVADTSS